MLGRRPVQLRRSTPSNYPETGSKVKTIKGKLYRANWDTDTYRGYGGRTLTIEYKKIASLHYTTLGFVQTHTDGTFTTTVTIPYSSTLRVTYNGSSLSGSSASSPDSVRVGN
jgi:hypothetical protein